MSNEKLPPRIARERKFATEMRKAKGTMNTEEMPNEFPAYLDKLREVCDGSIDTFILHQQEKDRTGNPVYHLNLEKDGYQFMIYIDLRIAKCKKDNPSEIEFIDVNDCLLYFRHDQWIDALDDKIQTTIDGRPERLKRLQRIEATFKRMTEVAAEMKDELARGEIPT